VGYPDELGDLAKSFNTMRVHLKDALEELQALTQSLESQVVERTQELRVAQEKLIRSDRLASLGQLAASVAHEINNPISGVLNFSMVVQRMIENGEIPPGEIENVRRYLRLISEETMRVGRIVSDLLAFSRTASPQGELMDLNELVGHVLTLLSHRLELEQVEVVMDLAEELPQLSGDSSQIQQVLINLLMNAAEACSGEGRIHVRTRVSADNTSVVLELEDNGQGIAAENLSRIFDPFFSTKEEGKGVGLGLSVVYGIIEAHGGSIDVQSHPGKGTTFRVILPIQHESPVTPSGAPVDAEGATDSSEKGGET
jgi:two-component system NtrC family sensor kinase